MIIRSVQMEVIPGNPKANFETCKRYVSEAKREGVNLIIFPELSIPGYLIGDMWEEQSFLNDCIFYGELLAKESTDISIIFGNVLVCSSNGTDGRIAKVNAAFVAMDGKIIDRKYVKTLLPNYREFEEPRHFKDASWYGLGNNFEPFDINGLKVGICICEDAWDSDYLINPIKEISKHNPDIIVNISCSPFTINKNTSRERVFSDHAKNNSLPLFYVNCIGLQNNGKTLFTFDGDSTVYDKHGSIISKLGHFRTGYSDTEYLNGDIYNKFSSFCCDYFQSEDEQIYMCLIYGIKKFLSQSGITKVVIGSSGGIDSAVASALYVDAIGSKNVYLVNMPSEFNSKTTKDLSKKLSDNLGTHYTEVSINDSVRHTEFQIRNCVFVRGKSEQRLSLSSFNLENIQARDRSSRILAGIASSIGGVFTNNGNKTELTVGYCTMLGDLSGFMACLADLWKHQVYSLGRFINKIHGDKYIPEEIFEIPPSAELSSDQSIDDGKGDPIIYWYHDYLFKSWVERWDRCSPEDILKHYISGDLLKFLGIDKPEKCLYDIFEDKTKFTNDLEKWWGLFKGMGVIKRIQAPPVLGISRRSFGFDYRESITPVYFSREYFRLKEL